MSKIRVTSKPTKRLSERELQTLHRSLDTLRRPSSMRDMTKACRSPAIQARECETITARQGRDPLGWAHVHYNADDDRAGEREGYLDVFVQPQARGRGVGKQLVNRAVAVARRKRINELLAMPVDKQGDRFYQSTGFKPDSRLNGLQIYRVSGEPLALIGGLSKRQQIARMSRALRRHGYPGAVASDLWEQGVRPRALTRSLKQDPDHLRLRYPRSGGAHASIPRRVHNTLDDTANEAERRYSLYLLLEHYKQQGAPVPADTDRILKMGKLLHRYGYPRSIAVKLSAAGYTPEVLKNILDEDERRPSPFSLARMHSLPRRISGDSVMFTNAHEPVDTIAGRRKPKNQKLQKALRKHAKTDPTYRSKVDQYAEVYGVSPAEFERRLIRLERYISNKFPLLDDHQKSSLMGAAIQRSRRFRAFIDDYERQEQADLAADLVELHQRRRNRDPNINGSLESPGDTMFHSNAAEPIHVGASGRTLTDAQKKTLRRLMSSGATPEQVIASLKARRRQRVGSLGSSGGIAPAEIIGARKRATKQQQQRDAFYADYVNREFMGQLTDAEKAARANVDFLGGSEAIRARKAQQRAFLKRLSAGDVPGFKLKKKTRVGSVMPGLGSLGSSGGIAPAEIIGAARRKLNARSIAKQAQAALQQQRWPVGTGIQMSVPKGYYQFERIGESTAEIIGAVRRAKDAKRASRSTSRKKAIRELQDFAAAMNESNRRRDKRPIPLLHAETEFIPEGYYTVNAPYPELKRARLTRLSPGRPLRVSGAVHSSACDPIGCVNPDSVSGYEVIGTEDLAKLTRRLPTSEAPPMAVWLKTLFRREGTWLIATTYLVANSQTKVFEVQLDLQPIMNALVRYHAKLHGGAVKVGFLGGIAKAVKKIGRSKLVKSISSGVKGAVKAVAKPVAKFSTKLAMVNPAMGLAAATLSTKAGANVKGPLGAFARVSNQFAASMAPPVSTTALGAYASASKGLQAIAKGNAFIKTAGKLAGKVKLATAAQNNALKSSIAKKVASNPLVKKAVTTAVKKATVVKAKAKAIAKNPAVQTAAKKVLAERQLALKSFAKLAATAKTSKDPIKKLEAQKSVRIINLAKKNQDELKTAAQQNAGGLPGLLIDAKGKVTKGRFVQRKGKRSSKAAPTLLYRGPGQKVAPGEFSRVSGQRVSGYDMIGTLPEYEAPYGGHISPDQPEYVGASDVGRAHVFPGRSRDNFDRSTEIGRRTRFIQSAAICALRAAYMRHPYGPKKNLRKIARDSLVRRGFGKPQATLAIINALGLPYGTKVGARLPSRVMKHDVALRYAHRLFKTAERKHPTYSIHKLIDVAAGRFRKHTGASLTEARHTVNAAIAKDPSIIAGIVGARLPSRVMKHDVALRYAHRLFKTAERKHPTYSIHKLIDVAAGRFRKHTGASLTEARHTINAAIAKDPSIIAGSSKAPNQTLTPYADSIRSARALLARAKTRFPSAGPERLVRLATGYYQRMHGVSKTEAAAVVRAALQRASISKKAGISGDELEALIGCDCQKQHAAA